MKRSALIRHLKRHGCRRIREGDAIPGGAASSTWAGSNFVVCLQNAGHEVSLNRGSRYRIVPDADASGHHQVRVIDESGED